VPARDPRAAARALTSLAADRPRLARMSDAAVAVAATHTWDRAARAHLAALRAAVPDLAPMPADLEDLQRHARRHAP
jgi:hypothetical protein